MHYLRVNSVNQKTEQIVVRDRDQIIFETIAQKLEHGELDVLLSTLRQLTMNSEIYYFFLRNN